MQIRVSNVALILFVLMLSGFALYASQSFVATPLNDLGTKTYLGFEGGLYQNGTNTVPVAHNSDGMLFTNEIVPLDINGNPDKTDGEVVMLSLGMSNALIEFGTFESAAGDSKLVNHNTLVVWNGAQSGQDACYWFPANGSPACSPSTQNEYDRIIAGLAAANLSAMQVQAVWIDNANGRVHSENRGCQPQGTLCVSLCNSAVKGCVNTDNKTNALNEEQEFGETLRAAKQRFPNLKQAFFSGRVYGGYAVGGEDDADPEPFAYESGFAVKWLIQAQINQAATGVVDPVAGDLSYQHAPWVAWGPYFWADGATPRSDGLVWCFGQKGTPCNGEFDFSSGGLHLNPTGANKAANLMLNYFTTAPYTAPWFSATDNPPSGGGHGGR